MLQEITGRKKKAKGQGWLSLIGLGRYYRQPSTFQTLRKLSRFPFRFKLTFLLSITFFFIPTITPMPVISVKSSNSSELKRRYIIKPVKFYKRWTFLRISATFKYIMKILNFLNSTKANTFFEQSFKHFFFH